MDAVEAGADAEKNTSDDGPWLCGGARAKQVVVKQIPHPARGRGFGMTARGGGEAEAGAMRTIRG
jgi:hypothetical protein